MGSVDDLLTAPFANRVISDDFAGMTHDHAAGQHHDLHRLTNQAPRDRVAVGIEVNRAIGPNLADQVAQLAKGSTAAQWSKHPGLIREPHDG